MRKQQPHDRARPVPLRFRLMRLVPTPVLRMLTHAGAPHVSLGTSAIIWDAEGRVCIVRHTYRRSAWGFPSGLVKRGEQPAMALLREVREELSVAATEGPLLHAQISMPFPHLTLFYTIYLQGVPQYDGVEIDGMCYIALEELDSFLGVPADPWLFQARARRARS